MVGARAARRGRDRGRLPGEPLRPPLLLGALAIVSGGVAARRRARPARATCAAIGLVYAAGAAVLFATRDNLARALHTDASPEHRGRRDADRRHRRGRALDEAAADDAGAARGSRRPGLLFGLSYVCLFEAYFRGRVTVVSPLIATESLWGVGLSALLIRQTEGMGRRIVARRAARRRGRRPDRRDRRR